MIDRLYSHKDMKNLVDTKGWEGLMNKLEQDFPQHDLYTVSQDWYKDQKYILKAKGGNGDVIIGWLENELEERRL